MTAPYLSSLHQLQKFALAEQRRVLDRVLRIPDLLEHTRNIRVGTTPHDVVYRRNQLRLLRYRRASPAILGPPVLLCYALVNRPYILDLQPGKSVVEQYLKSGYDVYLLDWGEPGDDDRNLKLEDYVCALLEPVVQHILHAHGVRRLHLLGYCMGGTLSLILTALYPQLVETLSLLAAPLDFARKRSLLNVWTDPDHFDVDAFIDAHGNCPAWFLQACFLNLRPVQNILEKNLSLYEQMDDSDFLTSYFAMDRWTNDNIPVAGETFREFVKNFYQQNQLMRESFTSAIGA